MTDGKFICTGGEDGTIRFWNPKNGVCKCMFDRLPDDEFVTSLSTSGDLIGAGSLSIVTKFTFFTIFQVLVMVL